MLLALSEITLIYIRIPSYLTSVHIWLSLESCSKPKWQVRVPTSVPQFFAFGSHISNVAKYARINVGNSFSPLVQTAAWICLSTAVQSWRRKTRSTGLASLLTLHFTSFIKLVRVFRLSHSAGIPMPTVSKTNKRNRHSAPIRFRNLYSCVLAVLSKQTDLETDRLIAVFISNR